MLRAVVIDSREPSWCQKLMLGGLVPTVQMLTCGDAWLATDDAMIVVERKSLADLCASIADGRLLNQVVEMRKASPWCYVVITGAPTPNAPGSKMVINGRATQWQWSSIQGALLTVQELGVGVAWCANDAQYAPMLERLAGRSRGPVQIGARRDATIETPAERILSSLPGIAHTRVASLLNHCGSVAWALDFLTGDRGGTVPGIGATTRQNVRNVLGLPDDMRLAVVERDDQDD